MGRDGPSGVRHDLGGLSVMSSTQLAFSLGYRHRLRALGGHLAQRQSAGDDRARLVINGGHDHHVDQISGPVQRLLTAAPSERLG